MTIPDNIEFNVDRTKPINKNYGDMFYVCFTCAVKFIMAGRIVEAKLVEGGGICYNDDCPKRKAEDHA